jgi:DNA-3-methyladenine glycosylase I
VSEPGNAGPALGAATEQQAKAGKSPVAGNDLVAGNDSVAGKGPGPVAGKGPVAGPDGQPRCPWAVSAPIYLAYHDEEWGRPVRDDTGIFERLCLEGFQSGLSWLTILRKRENFRAAFAGFDPAAVAEFGPADEARLLADPGIVRNRAKIQATITNARAALTVPGGLAAFLWRYAGGASQAPVTTADIPALTPGSRACARELRRMGFTFVGPVTVYAALQACGIVDDHLSGCIRRGAYS